MANDIRFYDTASSTHNCLNKLESYLDNNHEYIPHSVHGDLVDIFERLNNDLEEVIDDYEKQISELKDQLEELTNSKQ